MAIPNSDSHPSTSSSSSPMTLRVSPPCLLECFAQRDVLDPALRSSSSRRKAMNLINTLLVAPIAAHNTELGASIAFGTAWWFIFVGICCCLVIFAGLMSGLTIGLMSMSLVDLEILRRSGSSTEKKQATAILPVLQKQHRLLVTLLLCNAASMENLVLVELQLKIAGYEVDIGNLKMELENVRSSNKTSKIDELQTQEAVVLKSKLDIEMRKMEKFEASIADSDKKNQLITRLEKDSTRIQKELRELEAQQAGTEKNQLTVKNVILA